MDASTKARLHAFSRGECSSREVREQTGLEYSQFLDALGELGLKMPGFDYDTADEDLKRGYDNLVAYFLAHKREQETAKNTPARLLAAEAAAPKKLWKVTVSSLFPNDHRLVKTYEGYHASEDAACGAALHNEGIDHGGSSIPTILKVEEAG